MRNEMLSEIVDHLRKFMNQDAVDLWLNSKNTAFQGLNSYEYVEKVMRHDDQLTYSKAWYAVLEIVKRTFK